MELRDQMKSDWRQFFCSFPAVGFDTSANQSSSLRLEGNLDRFCSMWTDAEQERIKSCNNRSFAMDARIRLDHLKSGCNSPLPCSAVDGKLYNYNCEKDLWDSDDSQDEESALDLVELLDVEDEVKDEENWLYEPPKKEAFVERSESTLGWCRHVLDNPSPEMEVACRSLINKLDQKSSSHFYRRPAVFHHTGDVSVESSMDKTSVSRTYNTSESKDNKELSIPNDSLSSSYRLQDMTDVRIMARLQEASLRQDYVSMPSGTSSRRDPHTEFPRYFNTTVENTDDFTPSNMTEVTSSSSWQPGLYSPSSSSCQSPPQVAKQGCQSPKLARLHQQVTQFKLLKLAQNQATTPGRTRSPLRTSLRSLQAVRNSRSLDTDDYQPVDSQTTFAPSGESSVIKGSPCWSPSLSAASMNSNGSLHSVKASLDRTAALKKPQRSQSVSPCRIRHPAKGYLSVHGRVFASPERSTAIAWARNAPSTQR